MMFQKQQRIRATTQSIKTPRAPWILSTIALILFAVPIGWMWLLDDHKDDILFGPVLVLGIIPAAVAWGMSLILSGMGIARSISLWRKNVVSDRRELNRFSVIYVILITSLILLTSAYLSIYILSSGLDGISRIYN